MLFLVLMIVWLGLCLLLAIGTLFLQGYFDETPPAVKEVSWRALAGGTLVAGFLGLWVWLATGNPDRYAALTDFSATQQSTYFPKMKYVAGKVTTEVFLRKDDRGRPVYLNAQRAAMPSRPDEIIIVEEGENVRFLSDRGADGKFTVEPGRGLFYRDERGRIMEEGYLGQITTRRTGWLLGYLLLTLMHGVVWLATFWPIMGFRLGSSIVAALTAWVVSTLFVLPPLIGQARKVYEEKTRIQEKQENVREGGNDRREGLATLPLLSGLRAVTAQGSAGDRAMVSRAIRMGSHHLAATEAPGISIFTETSWPALTVTRSSFTWPFSSAFRV
jgi:hypothetical protein